MSEQTDPAEQPPKTYTFDTAIVGARFYEGATRLLESSAAADPELAPTVALVREPDNKFDKNAIAVYLDKKKVGHTPAAQAKILAPRLDSGTKVLSVKRRGVTGLILTLEKTEEKDDPLPPEWTDEPSLQPDELGD